MSGKVVAVNLSLRRGERKTPAPEGFLETGRGLAGDAHAGPWHRQVSLLADEAAQTMRQRGAAVGPGDFAENITVAGFDLGALSVGSRIRVGAALLEVTQIGKECHRHCEIYRQVGDCVMPREGVFARVLAGGPVRTGDAVAAQDAAPPAAAGGREGAGGKRKA